jgi:flavin reductase (DIM6/NTAB) family NADH-FMN oxidoreductase RutF
MSINTVSQVSADVLRRAAGQFATGITVVSVHDDGYVRGMTANSFTSVSLEPPLVLVSVDLQRSAHSALLTAERFVISVLAASQQAVSARFASSKTDMRRAYDDIPHRLTDDGLPLIDGALAHFVCRRYANYPGGDHTLFLGLVEDVEVNGGDPLLYVAGAYRTLDQAAGGSK